MENPKGPQSIRVAVNIRPLVTCELDAGSADCIAVTAGEPQVHIGAHSFTFDHVYGTTGSTPSRIFGDCVAPLVESFFQGYNGSVLAYGQTGSGKTHLMGTNYNGEGTDGIIPEVMRAIFRHIEETKENAECLITVSFIEIFEDKIFDLLAAVYTKANGKGPALQIRETADIGILIANVTEAEVTSEAEMASYLLRGSACRATASTLMNSHSSRSHAIFTISMVKKLIAGGGSLRGKLNLVDLAGSESAKKTGAADRMRIREGSGINKGLLALGNVISALGDDKKPKGGHVPYRDSKLTRLLQDSLGGNSKTVMIACVSPADKNAKETLNTLKYANRARNIQNKAIVNRDPARMPMMKNQIEQLHSSTPFEELQILKQKISSLESSKTGLLKKLQEHEVTIEHLTKQATDAQIMKQKISSLERSKTELQKKLQEHLTKQATDAQFEKDNLLLKLESARDGKPWDEIDCDSNKGPHLLEDMDISESEYMGTSASEDMGTSASEDTGISESEDEGIPWLHSEESDSASDNEQKQMGADRQTRRRVAWSQKESDFLKEAVTSRQPSAGRVPWKKILKRGAWVFSTHRTPADLKEKWRRIKKQAVFSGDEGSTSENLDKKAENKQRQKKRRLPVAWSQSEMDALEKWVGLFDPKQAVKPLRRLRWKRILELGCSEFLVDRTPTDLKDKWRRMRKQKGV